ncbi:hypothetical protein B0A48_06793 [Cryoendolithus antarcticus]|uniref:DUF2828 domain-containing protein n=1 Tax=Cryoendolithus antarcticus TaxID=1507870 RepID=A0A1V8T9H6_9PEZI|nr:hypothetical protein B0A48_06793 [Cryoendolithus antarcticus]
MADTTATAPAAMPPPTSRFMDALLANARPSLDSTDNKMVTDNSDLAFRTSGSPLVDVFNGLTDAITPSLLATYLSEAWAENPDATLRIIWNARSIHVGKADRTCFYRALGWLKENHPQTLLVNLPWLVRPVIQKKLPKAAEATFGEEDAMMVNASDDKEFELVDGAQNLVKASAVGWEEKAGEQTQEEQDTCLSAFDIKYGVSHGYWKDLLNILSLAARDELHSGGDPRKVFNVDHRPTAKNVTMWKKKWALDKHNQSADRYVGIDMTNLDPKQRDWTKDRKKAVVKAQHTKIVAKLANDEFYNTLHNTVASLFADQLKLDMARLQSDNKADKKQISLAAKWAPSSDGSHDYATAIVTTIAELLHPFETCCPDTLDRSDRKAYIKHARIAYQSKTLSPLRKFLLVVERDITAGTFDQIAYNKIPSLAMKTYTPLFIRKDTDHFSSYLEDVASGKTHISGAVLLPANLIHAVSRQPVFVGKKSTVEALIADKQNELQAKALDAQWNALVQRMRDSGTLASSIAVADVSGSMGSPVFPDKTTPMDSAIALSLLVAEITAPPFGGTFITFDQKPQILHIGGPSDKRTLAEKAAYVSSAPWGMNTDFVAVFEKLLLPLAIEKKLTRDEMVKQVFVFSDMHFDSADCGLDADAYSYRPGYGYGHVSGAHSTTTRTTWKSSFERIKTLYNDAGYDLPRLIFWNLAGRADGHHSYSTSSTPTSGNDQPKPVQAHEANTALVSGYSQGQMKMFLDTGSLEDAMAELVLEEEDELGNVIVRKEKKQESPLDVVKKAIGGEAYRMLRVVD